MICLRNFPQSNLFEQQTVADNRESAHSSNQDLKSPLSFQQPNPSQIPTPRDPRTLEITSDLPFRGHIKTLAGWCSPSLQERTTLTFSWSIWYSSWFSWLHRQTCFIFPQRIYRYLALSLLCAIYCVPFLPGGSKLLKGRGCLHLYSLCLKRAQPRQALWIVISEWLDNGMWCWWWHQLLSHSSLS